MRQPSRFSEVGFESMKMGVFFLFGRTKRPDLHRNSPPAFFAAFRWQLGARCSLDRCDNSRAAGVRLTRSFQANPLLVAHFVAPGVAQNKIKLISSEKKLPQLFDFIWPPGRKCPDILRTNASVIGATAVVDAKRWPL